VGRVVTTETTDAYAQSFGDALDAAAEVIPDLKRRWDASNDACPICRSMHGQIRALDEPFESTDEAPCAHVALDPRPDEVRRAARAPTLRVRGHRVPSRLVGLTAIHTEVSP
jgi:hypothetical protein